MVSFILSEIELRLYGHEVPNSTRRVYPGLSDDVEAVIKAHAALGQEKLTAQFHFSKFKVRCRWNFCANAPFRTSGSTLYPNPLSRVQLFFLALLLILSSSSLRLIDQAPALF